MIHLNSRARAAVALLSLLLLATPAGAQRPGPAGPPPGRGSRANAAPGSILQQYRTLLADARAAGLETAEAEALANQSATAIRNQNRAQAGELMRQAIRKLQAIVPSQGPDTERAPAWP